MSSEVESVVDGPSGGGVKCLNCTVVGSKAFLLLVWKACLVAWLKARLVAGRNACLVVGSKACLVMAKMPVL